MIIGVPREYLQHFLFVLCLELNITTAYREKMFPQSRLAKKFLFTRPRPKITVDNKDEYTCPFKVKE